MYKLNLKHHFSAAHHLKLDYESPCQKVHGHRWEVEVEIITNMLNVNGMVIDFQRIKELIDRFDHQDLNKIVEFNPTAENLAQYFHEKIGIMVNRKEVYAETKVIVSESPDASITYYEDE